MKRCLNRIPKQLVHDLITYKPSEELDMQLCPNQVPNQLFKDTNNLKKKVNNLDPQKYNPSFYFNPK